MGGGDAEEGGFSLPSKYRNWAVSYGRLRDLTVEREREMRIANGRTK